MRKKEIQAWKAAKKWLQDFNDDKCPWIHTPAADILTLMWQAEQQTKMKDNTVFALKIQCVGDVPKGYDVNSLTFDFGLDGKLVVKDAQGKKVKFSIGSTVTKRISVIRMMYEVDKP